MARGDRRDGRRRTPASVEALEARRLLSGAGQVATTPPPRIPQAPLVQAMAGNPAPVKARLPVRCSMSSRTLAPLRPRPVAAAVLAMARHPLRSRVLPAPQAAARPSPARNVQAADPMPMAAAPGPLPPADARFVALAVPQNQAVVTQAIVDLTNYVRAENGASPLAESPALMQAAQLHSSDMAAMDQMAHDLPGVPLATLTDRAAYVHYSYQLLGENVAYNQADPSSVVASWMSSPPHRENMLNPSFTDIGVGLAWNSRGEPYYTMMLGKPA